MKESLFNNNETFKPTNVHDRNYELIKKVWHEKGTNIFTHNTTIFASTFNNKEKVFIYIYEGHELPLPKLSFLLNERVRDAKRNIRSKLRERTRLIKLLENGII